MTEDNRQQNLALEWEHALRSLAAARVLLQSELHPDSVSRSYYAMLHAARAMLLTEGVECRTHQGVSQQVHLRCVRQGSFPAELARELARSQHDREAADYDRYAVFTEPMALAAISQTEQFLAAARQWIEERGFRV